MYRGGRVELVWFAVGDDLDYMTADEMAEAKHKADMDDKMKSMIREILFYVVLLFLLLVVINGQHACCPLVNQRTTRQKLIPPELQHLHAVQQEPQQRR